MGALRRGAERVFADATLAKISAKHGKTAAQVMLRWQIQRGIIVIPKSTHIERMRENFDVFGFALSDEDMAAIVALDKKQSSFFSHQDPTTVEWFVGVIKGETKA